MIRFSVAPGSVDSSGSGIAQSAGRRLSVAPGLEGGIGDHSLLPRSGSEVNIPGVRINLPEGHQSDSRYCMPITSFCINLGEIKDFLINAACK